MYGQVPQVLAFQEDFLVAYYIFILQTCQDPDLVESIFNFFFGEVGKFHLLEGVRLLVGESFHLEHDGICSLTCVSASLPSLAPMSNSFRDI